MSNTLLNRRLGEAITSFEDNSTNDDWRRAEHLAQALINATNGYYEQAGNIWKQGRFISQRIELGQLEHKGTCAQATGKVAVLAYEPTDSPEKIPYGIEFAVRVTPTQPISPDRVWHLAGGTLLRDRANTSSVSHMEHGLAEIAQAIGYNYRPVEEGFHDPFDSFPNA